jgi:hypothetical protein
MTMDECEGAISIPIPIGTHHERRMTMDECEGAISIPIPIGTHHERMPNIRIALTTNQLSFDEPTLLEDIIKKVG